MDTVTPAPALRHHPDVASLAAWELRDGEYVERAHVVGDESFNAEAPFVVSVTPSRLID